MRTSSTALPTRASNSCSDLSGRERTGGCCQSGLRGSLCIVVILTFATRSCKVCRLRGCRRGCTLQTHPPSNFVDELKTPTAVNTVRCYLVIMTWTNTVGWRASLALTRLVTCCANIRRHKGCASKRLVRQVQRKTVRDRRLRACRLATRDSGSRRIGCWIQQRQ